MDLGDLEHNTRDGLHMASLAGSWIAAVAGFGGMRDHGGEPDASARGCPRALARLRFRVRLPRALAARRRARTHEVTYELLDGEPLDDPPPRRARAAGGRRRRRRASGRRPQPGPEPAPAAGRAPAPPTPR